MERKPINEMDLEKVVGGTIMFSEDCSTCGYFCDNQYKVLNFDAALQYILDNKGKMSERNLLKKCVEAGYLANL